MALPKLVITDIDGVWTDGGMFYDQQGNEWKKFNTSDSAGVLFLRLMNIPVAIITGEDTQIVQRRADKLKIEHLYMGVQDKVGVAQKLITQLGLQWHEVAYIGDDINDMALLEKVGIAACPQNAPQYVKDKAQLMIPVKGGDGAFRAFVELMLEKEGLLGEVLSRYTQSMTFSQ